MDIVEKLEELIGSFGAIEPKRGGFEIMIRTAKIFPCMRSAKR